MRAGLRRELSRTASSQSMVFNPQVGSQVTTYSLYLPLMVR